VSSRCSFFIETELLLSETVKGDVLLGEHYKRAH
jgi:hypothetical protein